VLGKCQQRAFLVKVPSSRRAEMQIPKTFGKLTIRRAGAGLGRG